MVYIVQLNEGYDRTSIVEYGKCGKPKSLNEFVLLDTEYSKEEIANIEAVKYIEEDVKLQNMVHRPVNWGTASYDIFDLFNIKMGNDVNIYIHDTGIVSITELHNRVRHLYRPLSNRIRDKSHGTAVASMAGGIDNGVSMKCNIVDVETNLWLSDIIKGYDMILLDHLRHNNPSIVNMSYGGYGLPKIIFDVLKILAEHGIVLIAAAGNEGRSFPADPASSPYVIAVGAIDRNRNIASFSNRGSGINIYAPGQDIVLSSQISRRPWSGTSFSSPFVAGLCANIMQGRPRPRNWNDVLQIKEKLLSLTILRNNIPIIKTLESIQSSEEDTKIFNENITNNHNNHNNQNNQNNDKCLCPCSSSDKLNYLYVILLIILIVIIIIVYYCQKKRVNGMSGIKLI